MSVQCFLDAFFLQWYATLQIFQPPWVFRLNSSSPFQNKLIIIWGTAPWTQVLNMETFRFVSWNKVTKKNYQYYCGLCNTAWPCNALTIFVLCMPHWLPCNSCASIWNRKSCLDLFSCTFFLKDPDLHIIPIAPKIQRNVVSRLPLECKTWYKAKLTIVVCFSTLNETWFIINNLHAT